MLGFILRRVLNLVPLLLILTVIVFLLVEIAPGDPAAIIAGPDASPDAIAAIRGELGLDRPLHERYLAYVGNAIQGDLGTSFVTSEPVTDVIVRRLPRTVGLVALALLISVIVSIPLGLISALRASSIADRTVTVVSSVLIAVPPFVIAAVLVRYFALGGFASLPAVGYRPMSDGVGTWLTFAILPAVTIATISLAELTRTMRGSVIDAMEEDYIRTARAKGLGHVSIVGKHAFKNAAVPYVTILGLQVGRIVGAAVIVESIFNVTGFGQLGVEAVLERDLPTLQGVVLVSGLIVLAVNLLVDLSYGYLNPRTRTQ